MGKLLNQKNTSLFYVFFVLTSFVARYIDKNFEWKGNFYIPSHFKIIGLLVVLGVFVLVKYYILPQNVKFNSDIESAVMLLMSIICMMNIAYISFTFSYSKLLYIVFKSIEYVVLWDVCVCSGITILKTYIRNKYVLLGLEVVGVILLTIIFQGAIIQEVYV